MCPITINKALLLQEGILKFELSWTAVSANIVINIILIIFTVKYLLTIIYFISSHIISH